MSSALLKKTGWESLSGSLSGSKQHGQTHARKEKLRGILQRQRRTLGDLGSYLLHFSVDEPVGRQNGFAA